MSAEGETSDEALLTQLARAEANFTLLQRHAVRAIGVLGSAGAGKSTLIERLVERLVSCDLSVAIVAGDPIGNEDHRRFAARDIRSVALSTEGRPHLEAQAVNLALQSLPLDAIDLLFIENVGALLGPADYPLGVEREIVVVSVAEGEATIRKHPRLFAQTDLLVINKVDLAGAVGVAPQRITDDYTRINPHGSVVLADARHNRGIEDLLRALDIECATRPW
jgi:hydrogenase nickel incorporation protein HypB